MSSQNSIPSCIIHFTEILSPGFKYGSHHLSSWRSRQCPGHCMSTAALPSSWNASQALPSLSSDTYSAFLFGHAVLSENQFLYPRLIFLCYVPTSWLSLLQHCICGAGGDCNGCKHRPWSWSQLHHLHLCDLAGYLTFQGHSIIEDNVVPTPQGSRGIMWMTQCLWDMYLSTWHILSTCCMLA
jgi:hypothetical protein